jgi:Ca2+-binding EF-hand superfamily protein
MSSSDIDKLEKLFNDPETGLISMNALAKKVKENGINLPYKDIKEFYDKQHVNQIFAESKVNELNKITCSPRNSFSVMCN